MMKKWKKILIVLYILPLVFFSFACGDKNNQNKYNPNITYEIHFYSGTEEAYDIPDQIVKEGETARNPIGDPNINMHKEGYYFVGWYTEMQCINLWDFATPVTKNVYLYAKWAPNK